MTSLGDIRLLKTAMFWMRANNQNPTTSDLRLSSFAGSAYTSNNSDSDRNGMLSHTYEPEASATSSEESLSSIFPCAYFRLNWSGTMA